MVLLFSLHFLNFGKSFTYWASSWLPLVSDNPTRIDAAFYFDKTTWWSEKRKLSISVHSLAFLFDHINEYLSLLWWQVSKTIFRVSFNDGVRLTCRINCFLCVHHSIIYWREEESWENGNHCYSMWRWSNSQENRKGSQRRSFEKKSSQYKSIIS